MNFQLCSLIDDLSTQSAGYARLCDIQDVTGGTVAPTAAEAPELAAFFQLPTHNAFVGSVDLASFWKNLD